MNDIAFRMLGLVLARFPSAHTVYMEDFDGIWGINIFAITPSRTYCAVCTPIFNEINNVNEVSSSTHLRTIESSSFSWRRYNVEKIRRRTCSPCT